MQIKNVNLKQIHPAQSDARIFEEENSPVGESSCESVFSRTIFLQSESDGYKILYGFDIISALQKSGVKTVSAFVISKKRSFVDAINIIADFVLKLRPAWPIEVARSLSQCERYRIIHEKKSNLFRKLTGADLTRPLEERYLAMNQLEPLFQRFLAEKRAPLKTWILSTELPPAFQDLMRQILIECHPSLSVFEEICRNLLEILRRENNNPEALTKQMNWEKGNNSNDFQSSEKLTEFRDLLQTRRFPHLTQHRRKIAQILEAIKLPSSVRLEYDKNYEEPGYLINARIRTAEDLAELRNFINGSAKSKLEDLLNIF